MSSSCRHSVHGRLFLGFFPGMPSHYVRMRGSCIECPKKFKAFY
jgi:hypothetical protein